MSNKNTTKINNNKHKQAVNKPHFGSDDEVNNYRYELFSRRANISIPHFQPQSSFNAIKQDKCEFNYE